MKNNGAPLSLRNAIDLFFILKEVILESGRNEAVHKGELNEYFEGENYYYLHKGSKDPLADLPSPVYCLDKFLNEMKANQHLFNQPLLSMRLQQILSRLHEDPNPSPQVQGWQTDIQSILENISSNMQSYLKKGMKQLLEQEEKKTGEAEKANKAKEVEEAKKAKESRRSEESQRSRSSEESQRSRRSEES